MIYIPSEILDPEISKVQLHMTLARGRSLDISSMPAHICFTTPEGRDIIEVLMSPVENWAECVNQKMDGGSDRVLIWSPVTDPTKTTKIVGLLFHKDLSYPVTFLLPLDSTLNLNEVDIADISELFPMILRDYKYIVCH